MTQTRARLQWNLCFEVWHDASYGHQLRLITETTGRGAKSEVIGSWKGLGIPEPVLQQAVTVVAAAITEHAITRYGVQGELPEKWSGEPDPF